MYREHVEDGDRAERCSTGAGVRLFGRRIVGAACDVSPKGQGVVAEKERQVASCGQSPS
jgi:hypothetical protein